MFVQRISALLSLALISSPDELPANALSDNKNTKTASSLASSEETSQRASLRRMRHEWAPMPVLQPFEIQNQNITDKAPFFVGELGGQWQFPSDHLPIGMTIGGVHFACWNILNTDYLKHIETNSQGLKNSLIMETNCPGKDPRLTRREEIVLEQVMSLLQHPTQPRSVLSLQETGASFWEVLKERLPPNFETVTAFTNDLVHGDVFIYNSDLLVCEGLQSKKYECQPKNTIMALDLKERSSGIQYRFIQSHVPGGPILSEPARKELADFAMRNYDPNKVIVIMGDMNRPPRDFLNVFAQKAEEYSMTQPYMNASIPYPTHINTHREASWIDNFFFAIPREMQIKISEEDAFFPDHQEMIHLLNKLRPKD